MPFPFIYVCDLLDKLEQPHLRDAPYLSKDLKKIMQTETFKWFQRHKDKLNAFKTSDATVMSMLRPEVWTDRDYGLDTNSLELLMARILGLTRSQRVDLSKWRSEPWTGDIGAQVARILENRKRTTASAITATVDVEDIEIILLSIASHNEGSSDLIKELASACDRVISLPLHGLKKIYDRLQPREAKWLTRLLLKNTGVVTVPADFGVSSYQSQLPNCVKVHVELPASSPPLLQTGLNGVIKPSLPKGKSVAPEKTLPILRRPVQNSIPRRSSTPRGGSPESDLDDPRGGRRRIRQFSSTKRSVSRPKSPLKPRDASLPPVQHSSSVTSASLPATVDLPSHPPLAKRRKTSREGSPGALRFARGILKPPLAEVLYKRSPERAMSSHNQSKDQAFNKDLLFGVLNFPNCPSFKLGASSQTTRIQSSSNVNSNMPTPPKSSPAKNDWENFPPCHPKIPAVNKSEAQKPFKSKMGSLWSESSISETSPALQTPRTSDLTLHSSARSPTTRQASALGSISRTIDLSKREGQSPGTTSHTSGRTPIFRQVAMLANELEASAILNSKEPPNVASDLSAREPISRQVSMVVNEFNVAAPSITNPPGTVNTPHPSLPSGTLPDPISPLIKAGNGNCTLGTTTCPLINAIFLVPPNLPETVKTRLVMTLLPHHGAFYILSTSHFAHPSLPRRCPVTRLKYRKIVLVEPAETQVMLSILRGIENLEVKRSRGRKVWVECFDWRLLEGVGRRECGMQGSGANVWGRNWICCV